MNRRNTAAAITCALLILHLTLTLPAIADASARINQIERMPRPRRPQAYQTAVAQKGLPAADRQALVRAFARHAKDLSPLYGRGDFPFDPRSWRTILKDGFDPEKPDADVAWALAQLLIDSNDTAAALPIVTAFKKAHPQHHAALAWHEWCQPGRNKLPAPADLLTFPLHFSVVTANASARQAASREACRQECDLLNRSFRTLDGKQLVRFEFKSFTTYEQAKGANSELVRVLEQPYDGDAVLKAFNACDDARLRDPHAINVYIFDSRSPDGGDQDMTSHGKRNSNRPYVLIDHQRLGGKVQNAITHEIGHAFGLEHVGVPSAAARTSTNIMTSAGESFGSGGMRDLGFTPAQSALVLYHARRTHERLKSK